MGHIEATRELSASPEALWGTVSDLANWDKWFTVHEKWLEGPPDTLTEGAKLWRFNLGGSVASSYQATRDAGTGVLITPLAGAAVMAQAIAGAVSDRTAASLNPDHGATTDHFPSPVRLTFATSGAP